MKNKKYLKLLSMISSFLILVAPIFVSASACVTFWGEPECPDCLK